MWSSKWVKISFLLTVGITTWAAANINWGKTHYQNIIKADGRGYYAHLPALFIYNDLSFSFFDSIDGPEGRYYDPNLYYDYRSIIGSDTVNKYYAGTSIPMMPFFLGAHAISNLSQKHPADGYSKFYQISVNWAAIFYMALTLMLWIWILKKYRFSDELIAFLLPVMVFGTHWFYYVVVEPSMSHVYSIFFITFLAVSAIQINADEAFKDKRRYVWLFGLLLGLITAIRPINGLSGLFLLIFAPSIKVGIGSIIQILKKRLAILPAVVLFILPILFQLMIYKDQTGSWWVYSYQEEGFNFSKPQWVNMLFSYKKGLFLYTPILAISILGYFSYIKDKKWEGSSALAFLLLTIYILSSWWNWQYGGSFSSRVFIDYFILFVIPMAYLLRSVLTKWKKLAMYTTIVLLTLLCQFQTYQYRYEVIHWENMTKEKYWDVFLNTDFIRKKK